MSKAFEVRQAAVIGAGPMGRGIVMSLANAGVQVLWLDNNPEMLEQALGVVADTYAHNVRQGRVDEAEAAGGGGGAPPRRGAARGGGGGRGRGGRHLGPQRGPGAGRRGGGGGAPGPHRQGGGLPGAGRRGPGD